MFKPSSMLCSAFSKRFHLSLCFKSRWRHLKQRLAIARKLSPSESNRTFFCVFIGSEGILLLLSFFLKETIARYLLRLRSRYKIESPSLLQLPTPPPLPPQNAREAGFIGAESLQSPTHTGPPLWGLYLIIILL